MQVEIKNNLYYITYTVNATVSCDLVIYVHKTCVNLD